MKTREIVTLPKRILENSMNGKLNLGDISNLLSHKKELTEELIQTASQFNLQKFHKKIELYGVSYISDFCVNSCTYCGHSSLLKHLRSKLSEEEMKQDFLAILKHGPSELCILAGEDRRVNPEYLITAGNMALKCDIHKSLERITFNVAPMSIEDFRKIREGINFPLQFRIFQESYDVETYSKHHLAGPKKDFLFRLKAQERALKAGFDEVGIGTLLGLNEDGNDFEILELIKHAFNLKKEFGKFPYSVSIPRLQKIPSCNSFQVPKILDDETYFLYHTILRLALPEVKIIVTNRETLQLRDRLRPFINIEDLAARPGVGGNYKSNSSLQNVLGDIRTPEEIIKDLRKKGYFVKTVP